MVVSVSVVVSVVVAVVVAVALFVFGLSVVLSLFGFCLVASIVTGVLLDLCVADLSLFVVRGAPVVVGPLCVPVLCCLW